MPLAVVGWFGMNNLLTVSPNIGGTGAALIKIILFYGIALVVSAIGLTSTCRAAWRARGRRDVDHAAAGHPGTCTVMKFRRQRRDEDQPRQAVRDLPHKHTWSMTALYVVTFGSFIGFSMALPLSITVIFRQHPRRSGHPGLGAREEPNAPPR